MLNAPGGRPARSASTPSASADRGVSGAGFSTTVQPAASAGAILRVIMECGKFHGVIAAQTPIGWRSTTMPRVRAMARDGLAVDAARFLSRKFEIGRADVDLAQGFGKRLALLGGQDQGQILPVLDDEIGEAAHDLGPLLGEPLRPRTEGGLGGLDGADGLGRAEPRHARDLAPVRGVDDGVHALPDPGAADQQRV